MTKDVIEFFLCLCAVALLIFFAVIITNSVTDAAVCTTALDRSHTAQDSATVVRLQVCPAQRIAK